VSSVTLIANKIPLTPIVNISNTGVATIKAINKPTIITLYIYFYLHIINKNIPIIGDANYAKKKAHVGFHLSGNSYQSIFQFHGHVQLPSIKYLPNVHLILVNIVALFISLPP
jgi:hypothetical protein